MTTKAKNAMVLPINLRERATDASLNWTELEKRRNPGVMYAETIAWGKGWQAGYKAAQRDAQSLVLKAKRGR